MLSRNIRKCPEKYSGILLFQQDYKNGYLWMNYEEITSFFLKNYSPNWFEVRDLISGWLKKDTKLKALKPVFYLEKYISMLKKDTKLKALKPSPAIANVAFVLKKDTKLKALKPITNIK